MSSKEWLSCVAISVYHAFIVTYLGNAGYRRKSSATDLFLAYLCNVDVRIEVAMIQITLLSTS